MTLDIALDADAEEVSVVFNDHVVLRAHKDGDGKTVYGKNFSKVEDPAVSKLVRDVCHRLLNIDAD